jgi:hypothetical protein
MVAALPWLVSRKIPLLDVEKLLHETDLFYHWETLIDQPTRPAGDRDMVYEWGVGTVTTRSASGALDARGGPYLTVWKRQENGRCEIIRNVVGQD